MKIALVQKTFDNHKLTLKYYRYIFFFTSLIAFVISQYLNNFKICFWWTIIATVLSILLFAPGWKLYNQQGSKLQIHNHHKRNYEDEQFKVFKNNE